jgi:hypothetical protein
MSSIMPDKLATVGAVGLGVVVYGVLLIVTGTITREDLAMFSKGGRIADKLGRFLKSEKQ